MDLQSSSIAGKRTKFSTKPNTCHHTFSMLPHYLAKVHFCGNLQKKQSKNCVTFDKNWNISRHMAVYCHNSCLKCPPFAQTCEDAHATRQLRCQWWSGQCHAKHAGNTASVHNTCLHKIVCHLQRTFNRNWKLKQPVSKLNSLKLGVC